MNIFTINQLYWRKNPTHSFVVLKVLALSIDFFLTINLGKYVFEKSDFLVAVLNSFTVYQLHFLCRHQGLTIGVKVEMASSEKDTLVCLMKDKCFCSQNYVIYDRKSETQILKLKLRPRLQKLTRESFTCALKYCLPLQGRREYGGSNQWLR